jgi:hypothetical protein
MSKYKNNENDFLNPILLRNLTINRNDIDIDIDMLNIPKYFNKVYILCPQRFDNKLSHLNFKYINKKLFKSLANILVLYECDNKILKNKFHSSTINIMKNDDVDIFNNFGYILDDEIVVIPILKFKFLDIKKYVDMYNGGNSNLNDLYNLKFLIEYFSTSKKNFMYNQFINNIISSLKETNYWTQIYNCLLNFKNIFKKRNFKSENTVSKIETNSNNKISTDDVNYLDSLFRSKYYHDISNALKKRGYKLYKVTKRSDYSIGDINCVFDNLNEHQQYLLLCNLVISKRYCHLILMNSELLYKMKPVIHNFAELFRILFSYAFIRLYSDECELKGRIDEKSEFIFNLNSASKLPVYPVNEYNLQMNPYIPLLIPENLYNSGNVFGFPCYKNRLYNNGISTKEEFQDRLNIFLTCKNSNLFQNVDFIKNKMAITGSAVMACIQKRHPLVNLFDKINDKQVDFVTLYNRYFNEYYPKSDIDIMIKTSDMFEFIDICKNVYGDLVANICHIYTPYAEPNHQKIDFLKTIFLFVTPEFIKDNIANDIYSFDMICELLSGPITKIKSNENTQLQKILELFKPYFDKLYNLELNKKLNKKFNEDKNILMEKIKKYEDDNTKKTLNSELNNYEKILINFINDDNTDYNIYLSYLKKNHHEYFQMDNVEYQVKLQKLGKIKRMYNYKKMKGEKTNVFFETLLIKGINISYGFKCFISSPHLNHKLEIFPTKRFFMVDTFHKGCVRAFWDGNNCYMLPSCVMEHLTYIGIDYRYCSGKQHMVEIINKYRTRGFGTILNKTEKNIYIDYTRKKSKWNNLFGIHIDNKDSISKSLQFKGISSKIYRPRFFCMDEYINCPPIDVSAAYNDKLCSTKYERIINNNDFKKYIKNRYKTLDFEFNFCNYQAIDNRTGNIIPLNKNIIHIAYELASKYSCESKKKKSYKSKFVKNITI